MNMGTAAIALMLQLLNQVFIADALAPNNSVEPFHDEGIQLNNGCFTNDWIICDEGLVQIGYCCTRVSHLSDVAVYRLCPYTILTDQEVYIDGNLKFYSTIIITLTFQYLNKVVEHSIERVCSVQSAIMDMDQQSMHLLTSVSTVMAMHLVDGNSISLLFYSS